MVALLPLVGCGVNPLESPTARGAVITVDPSALTVSVADGSKAVPVDTLITVTSKDATVRDVEVTSTVTGKSAAEITGSTNAEGVWTGDTRLYPGATYTVIPREAALNGTEITSGSQFATVSLTSSDVAFPTLTRIAGGPFGVAEPIVIQFDLPVKDKAESERHLTVTSTPAQEGSWGWISDTEVHYRSKEYWQPGTTLHLDARLNGVNAGNGTFGQLNRTLDLTNGKRQTATVDLQTKQLTFTRMDSETTGIAGSSAEGYDLQVAWALRLTTSGEFFQAPWNDGKFGLVNANHGCTGLSTANAHQLYDQTQIGDPIQFTGSDRSMVQWRERSRL